MRTKAGAPARGRTRGEASAGRSGDRFIERRDVHSGDPGQDEDQILPRRAAGLARRDRVEDLEDGLLAVAEEERVDELRQGLRVEGRRASGDDERIAVRPVARAARDPAQVEDGQDVRVVELVEKREPEHVEPGKGDAALERRERQVPAPQLGLEVRPRGEDAFRESVGPGVDHVIKDLLAEIRHPDLIDVGERQPDPEGGPPGVLADGVPLPPRVAAGLLHRGQSGLERGGGGTIRH